MNSKKKLNLIAVILILVLAGFAPGKSWGLTIDVLQNGDFEANGGSLAGWNTYGDVSLITESSGNHFARLGGTAIDGTTLMSQYFIIGDNYLDQTLSVAYNFSFIDNNPYKFDVFATVIREGPTNVENPILLASYDSTAWTSSSGVFIDLLNPQLTAGTYALKFILTEGSWQMGAYVDIDNVSLTATVPEPSILMLLGSILIGIAAIGRTALRSNS